jgi:hypothetical protein
MKVQAIMSEAAQGAPSTRAARSAPGDKRKNSAKKKIAKAGAGRETKADAIVKLLGRKSGATIAELQEATGWQSHSVRGFLSGTVKTRLGLQLLSERTGKGARRYLIAKA